MRWLIIAVLTAASALVLAPRGSAVNATLATAFAGRAADETPARTALTHEPAMPPEPAGEETPAAGTAAAEAAETPVVEYDPARLPLPVRRLREQLMAAARSGDIERLRPIIDANPEPPTVSFDSEEDPIAFLKAQSGDGEGREILAILLEVLQAGYVHVDADTSQEMYIWPYFARYPIDTLSPPQMVELFELITAGDYEDMKNFGAYIFYRVGIGPDGSWQYFIAGD